MEYSLCCIANYGYHHQSPIPISLFCRATAIFPLPLLSPDAQRGHVLGPAALTVAAALKVHGDASRRHAQHVRAIIAKLLLFSVRTFSLLGEKGDCVL